MPAVELVSFDSTIAVTNLGHRLHSSLQQLDLIARIQAAVQSRTAGVVPGEPRLR
jgi:hypothetical protein